jgi:trehalose 6-phosphate phosphatase
VGALPDVLEPLAGDPGHSALFLDFDGTLAAIVADPADARPEPGVPELLARLAARFALVAVISGRPLSFLEEVLGAPPGVRLFGLYGLGQVGPDVGAWEPVMAGVAERARAGAPAGVRVESKGLTVALHWRGAAQGAPWVAAFAAGEEREQGLKVHGGRMVVELTPPVEVDKGTVVRALASNLRAMAVFGDDLGDLPAFAALDELAAQGVAVARVAVADRESAPEVAARADLVVQGAAGAMALLGQLAQVAGA